MTRRWRSHCWVGVVAIGSVCVVTACASGPPDSAPSAPPGSSATPTKEPTFSPGSVVVRAKETRGSQLVIQVTAPAHTRFRVGRNEPTALECTASAVAQGDPVTYRVVCPPGEPGSGLLATISYGDFDYTFVKPLG